LEEYVYGVTRIYRSSLVNSDMTFSIERTRPFFLQFCAIDPLLN